MKIEHYSDHSVSFRFNYSNKELTITLEYPQIRLSTNELRFSIPTVISIYKDDYPYRFDDKEVTCYLAELIILGFGITIDLDVIK